MLYHATIEKFVAALRDALPEVELISTSRSGGSNKMLRKMSLGGYVALGNFSCNLSHNKIAIQVSRYDIGFEQGFSFLLEEKADCM